MKLTQVKLENLVEDPQNARLHSDYNIEVIKASLKTHEQYAPLVVQKSTMIVVVGNGRFRAMREMGWKEAWCYVKDMSDREARALSIMDNRSAELATWDEKALADAFKTLETEVNLNDLGFTDDCVANILSSLEPDSAPPTGDIPPPDDKGTEVKGGRIVLVYATDEEKEFWQERIGIDGKKSVYTMQDIIDGENGGVDTDK